MNANSPPEKFRIAFDTGGTFTDFVLQDVRANQLHFWKVPSTSKDPAAAVLAGMDELLSSLDVSYRDLISILQATTVATNAILERKGSRTALVTTEGFRDIIFIGRQKRYETYDLYLDKPEPLVSRADVFEVRERVNFDGTVSLALDEASLDQAIEKIRESGYDSVAISLLHAYANPSHENTIKSRIEDAIDGIVISVSSDVSPKFREYERTSTVVADAYIKPIVAKYMDNLATALKERGAPGEFMIMQSNGGLLSPALARHYPIRIVESGPAAGVLMCGLIGREQGFDYVLTFDMGGTTAKLGAIDEGQPAIVSAFEVDQVRYRKGSGLPLNISAVELLEIGAGGGSIARVDMGLIHVGPESAGAEPGPICYGQGGERPTVTDANVVLGYINPEYFNGGAMTLDRAAAERGIAEHIGKPTGLSVEDAAWGIHAIANSNMERAMRIVSVEKGRDPRRYAMIGFGGAGPLHVCRLARALGVPKVIIPYGAGVGSAIGLLAADNKVDTSITRVMKIAEIDISTIAKLYNDLVIRLTGDLNMLGAPKNVIWLRFAYMRYVGQGYEIRVNLPEGDIDQAFVSETISQFHAAYQRHYGYHDSEAAIEGVDWHLMATVPSANSNFRPLLTSGTGATADDRKDEIRRAYFSEAGGYVDCLIVRREALRPGETISGPVIIEDKESTTVVPPGDTVSIGETRDLIVSIQTEPNQ